MSDAASVDVVIIDLLDGAGFELPDVEHAIRCARFAATLFSCFHEHLGLDPGLWRVAVAASLFHDVGYLRSDRDHHRKSFDILRRLELPGISADEQMIVACAARYHGGVYPNIEHAGFGEMSAEDQRAVRRIAAITRVAAALDASHLGIIERITCGTDGEGAWLVLHASTEPAVERDRVWEAAGAFETLTRVPLRTSVVIE